MWYILFMFAQSHMRALSFCMDFEQNLSVKWDKCSNLRPHTQMHTVHCTQCTINALFLTIAQASQTRRKKMCMKKEANLKICERNKHELHFIYRRLSVRLHSLLVHLNKCHPFTMKIHWIELNWIVCVWNGRAYIFYYRSINHILFVNRQTSVI